MPQPSPTTDRERLARSIVILCATGVALGVSFNYFALQQPRGRGLPWIAEDRMAALASGPSVRADGGNGSPSASAERDEFTTANADPFAVSSDTPALPEIPAIGRPVAIETEAVELYVEAGAALILDAREADEYHAGHIPGAVNLPYERVITDPAALETLETDGRPIIAYCGGGECEVSLSLANELIALGFERVAVYTGGFPEWEAFELPVARGDGR
ncbi:MAG TPA: rhodanese-like domain-containing protein [Candidatus Polarisedimenticolaceae bacterium]|nr:rhodanese-like domain-containing protein [Candidatus Polarisedimenticolaceae bacterium]